MFALRFCSPIHSKRIPLEDVHLRIIQLYPKLVKKQPKPTKSKTDETHKSSNGDKQDPIEPKKSKTSEEDTKKKKPLKTETIEPEEKQNDKNKKPKKPSKSDSKISDTVFEENSSAEPIPKSSSKNSKTGVEKEEIPDIISLENQPENERIYDLYWSNGTDKFCILKGDDAEFQRAVKVGVCVSLVS